MSAPFRPGGTRRRKFVRIAPDSPYSELTPADTLPTVLLRRTRRLRHKSVFMRNFCSQNRPGPNSRVIPPKHTKVGSVCDDPLRNTRRSLVERLGNPDDRASWQTFFDCYGGLLYRVARAAGLTDSEAQEAVQETVITVARNVGELRYDPATGSFKGWLLQTARWRIADQFRLRQRRDRLEVSAAAWSMDGDSSHPGAIEQLPDPGGFNLESVWEAEWRGSLLEAALARVRRQTDPKQFQIFDCYKDISKGWPATRVARELGVSLAQVYVAKYRVGANLRKIVANLEAGGH